MVLATGKKVRGKGPDVSTKQETKKPKKTPYSLGSKDKIHHFEQNENSSFPMQGSKINPEHVRKMYTNCLAADFVS